MDKDSAVSKLIYARKCLDANPEAAPQLRLFVRWLMGEALADEVDQHLRVLSLPLQLSKDAT